MIQTPRHFFAEETFPGFAFNIAIFTFDNQQFSGLFTTPGQILPFGPDPITNLLVFAATDTGLVLQPDEVSPTRLDIYEPLDPDTSINYRYTGRVDAPSGYTFAGTPALTMNDEYIYAGAFDTVNFHPYILTYKRTIVVPAPNLQSTWAVVSPPFLLVADPSPLFVSLVVQPPACANHGLVLAGLYAPWYVQILVPDDTTGQLSLAMQIDNVFPLGPALLSADMSCHQFILATDPNATVYSFNSSLQVFDQQVITPACINNVALANETLLITCSNDHGACTHRGYVQRYAPIGGLSLEGAVQWSPASTF